MKIDPQDYNNFSQELISLVQQKKLDPKTEKECLRILRSNKDNLNPPDLQAGLKFFISQDVNLPREDKNRFYSLVDNYIKSQTQPQAQTFHGAAAQAAPPRPTSQRPSLETLKQGIQNLANSNLIDPKTSNLLCAEIDKHKGDFNINRFVAHGCK